MFEAIRFSVFQFFFWSSIVCFEAFMVPYLRSLGYSPAQIGPVMSAVFGLAVVGQPLLGSLSDRVRSPRYLVAAALVIAGSAVALIPLVGRYYAAIVGVVLVYSLTANSLPAVLDAWLMERRATNPRINYGVSRGLGSAGFATGGLLFGVLTERYGPAVVFPAFLVLAVIAAAIAIGMPQRERHPVTNTRRGVEAIRNGVRAALANRAYIALLVASLLAFTGLRAGLTFLPILIESLGGSLTAVGSAHSIGAISEIPFFFLAAYILKRFEGRRLIATVLVLLAVRLYSYTLLVTAPQILVLQISHGITFGVFLAASVDYIHRIAPPEHRGFFQALAPSIYFGFGSIFGGWIGGIVIESFSIAVLYRGSAVLALIGALVLFLSRDPA